MMIRDKRRAHSFTLILKPETSPSNLKEAPYNIIHTRSSFAAEKHHHSIPHHNIHPRRLGLPGPPRSSRLKPLLHLCDIHRDALALQNHGGDLFFLPLGFLCFFLLLCCRRRLPRVPDVGPFARYFVFVFLADL